MKRTRAWGAAALLAIVTVGCASGTRKFPLRDPMWRDPDDAPLAQKPAEYWSPLAWDGIDNTIFRPISRFFAVEPAGESTNVNALDEVPDSSWFENRLGQKKLTLDEFREGPCMGKPPLSAKGPWTVVSAKPNGANPGFMIKAEDGRKFLVKYEVDQPERASSADVVGTRVYWAAGFTTPCNVIVSMKPDILRIDPKAKAEEDGKKVKLDQHHLDKIFAALPKQADGTYRANASLLLDGEPIGPWRYHGVRDDDPNDVVPHEDRREVRAGRVLAAWLHHHDAREQNTLAVWVPVDGKRGYVRHDIIDWGDCLGGLWDWEGLSKRTGHAYYLDFQYLALDFVTLGIPRRPWDDLHYGPAGATLGYWDVDHFSPEDWHVGYPNPAFGRMSERDAAWMARIVARFDDAAVDAIVDAAQVKNPVTDHEIRRILKGRRDRILRRWLGTLSALTGPELEGDKLCMEDLLVTTGLAPVETRKYVVRGFASDALQEVDMPVPTTPSKGRICTKVPRVAGASKTAPKYVIVDVAGVSDLFPSRAPSRVHLYDLGTELKVVGLERPASPARP